MFAGQQFPTPAGLERPDAQVAHAVVLPKPYVPEAQGWHEVELPSTKYWPVVQQTGEPAGVQCTVPLQPVMVHWSGRTGVYVSPRKL